MKSVTHSAACVADTHIIIWVMATSPRLSPAAVQALQAAEKQLAPVYVSAITLVEMRYLIEKGKLMEPDYQRTMQALNDPAVMMTLVPLDQQIADALAQIPRATVPEMPDRIIAATALALGLPLVTADTEIRKLTNIQLIW